MEQDKAAQKAIKDELDRICSKEAEIVLIGQRVNQITERLNEQLQLARDVHTLIIELRVLKDDVEESRDKIAAINAKPAETLKWLLGLVGGAVITASMAIILKAVGLI